jgi:hypothetical protein
LGGHLAECNKCGHCTNLYNSCRNRHCPKCQSAARAAWLEKRAAELLPIPYFHVVFTLPAALRPLALQNKRVVYGILFQAAAETLLAIAADPNHLGARIGVLMVLHTWSQNLMHHPHVHCVASGGGICVDGSRWIHSRVSRKSRKPFFLPVHILSPVFRGKFMYRLKQAFAAGLLTFHGKMQAFAKPMHFEQLLNLAVRHNWVVYAKRPFGGPKQALKYLARYTHRVAISNSRLVSVADGKVQFRWKDYADQNRQKLMTLTATEFLRRFLMHVLPQGFVRIRHYGFLSNRHRQEKLALCRKLLGCNESSGSTTAASSPQEARQQTEIEQYLPVPACAICPACKLGHMKIIAELRRTVLLSHWVKPLKQFLSRGQMPIKVQDRSDAACPVSADTS